MPNADPVTDTADAPTLRGSSAGRSGRAGVVVVAAIEALSLLLASVLTAYRLTAPYINPDGIEMSLMSVQDIQLFFWGQDRLFPLIGLLASPIADPGWNLVACVVLNAMAMYGLLLLLAHLIARIVPDHGRFLPLAMFAALVLALHLVFTERAVYVLTIEGQPYALSYLLTIGGFLLWRRGGWWRWALGAVLSWAAVGTNPTALVLAAVLAGVEALRRWRWLTWIVYGAFWIGLFLLWNWLSARFGEQGGPYDHPLDSYMTFTAFEFSKGLAPMVAEVLRNVQPLQFYGLVLLACAAVTLLPADVRARLLFRGGIAGGYALLAAGFFVGNTWIAMNNFEIRYFSPLLFLLILATGVPIGLAVASPITLPFGARWAQRVRLPRWQSTVAALVGVVVALGVISWGPFSRPQDALALERTKPTAEFAEANDIDFISGDYWVMWPILHNMLDEGRRSAYVTGYKSGGDPAEYKKLFAEDLRENPHPRALCVGADDKFCTDHLDLWTAPGWQRVQPEINCPVPVTEGAPLGQIPKTCVVLEYTGQP